MRLYQLLSRMGLLGILSGAPLPISFSILSLRLRDAGLDLTTIAALSLATLPYSLKFLWAPFLDVKSAPLFGLFFGRRKSWVLFSQILIAVVTTLIAMVDPSSGGYSLSVWSIFLVFFCFSSATLDIAIDAYRVSSGGIDIQPRISAWFTIGHRIGMLVSGAGILHMVSYSGSTMYSWKAALILFAILYGGSALLTAFFLKESDSSLSDLKGMSLLLEPVTAFFRQYGWLQGSKIMLLVCLYRISDMLQGTILNVFYQDIGYDKATIANVGQIYGLVATLLGAWLGGRLGSRMRIDSALFWSALLCGISNLIFIPLETYAPNLFFLALSVGVENVCAGLASTILILFFAHIVDIKFSGSQIAVFTSIMTIIPKFLGATSGLVVDSYGYANFFMASASLTLPVLILVRISSSALRKKI